MIEIIIICVVLSRSTSLYIRRDFWNMTLPLDDRVEQICIKQLKVIDLAAKLPYLARKNN